MSELSDLSLGNVCLSSREANERRALDLGQFLFDYVFNFVTATNMDDAIHAQAWIKDLDQADQDDVVWPLVTYGMIMNHFGWSFVELNAIMRALFDRDVAMERCYFTSLIVSKKSGTPSIGFYRCCEAHEIQCGSNDAQRIHFWRREVGRVIGFVEGMSYTERVQIPE